MNSLRALPIVFFAFCLSAAAATGNILPQVLRQINPDVQPIEDPSHQDPVDLANEFIKQRLTPAIENEAFTQDDLKCLAFCLTVMYAQAKQYGSFVEHYMGLDRLTVEWPEINIGNIDLERGLINLRKEFSDSPIEGREAAVLRSFCQKYNTKNGTQLFMGDKLNKIVQESQQEEAINPDSYADIRMDVSKYGNYPKLGWWARNGHYVPLLGSAIKEWQRRKYFVETVPATNESVEAYLEKRRLVPAGLNDVLEDRAGPYRKPYDDLARVVRLLKKCRERGWSGLGISDQDKKMLDLSAEKAEASARNMLKYMERAYVDYPLIFELTEATTICLYLHYLDEHDDGVFGSRLLSYTNQTYGIRSRFLDDAENLGDISSRFLAHSSLNTAKHLADVYNRAFPWVYATNRNDFARGGIDDAQIVFRKKYDPLLLDTESARVKSGEIEIRQRDLRSKMQDVIQRLASDSDLQQVLAASLGEEKFKDWFAKAQRIIPDLILYPLWCDETVDILFDSSAAKKVEKTYDEWIRGPAQKIKLKVMTIRDTVTKDEESTRSLWDRVWGKSDTVKGLKSFSNCIEKADDVEEMKRLLLYDMKENRKVDERLGKKLDGIEESIDEWLRKLSGETSIKELQGYAVKEILPLWTESQKAKRKINW